MENNQFIWRAQVRGYELDYQGIVNNANYLHYFDETRVQHLNSLAIDWNYWHEQGIHFVVAETKIRFKAPLKAHDEFHVTSKFTLSGQIRILVTQKIFRSSDNILMTEATNTLVCLNKNTGKPCLPKELSKQLFL